MLILKPSPRHSRRGITLKVGYQCDHLCSSPSIRSSNSSDLSGVLFCPTMLAAWRKKSRIGSFIIFSKTTEKIQN